jgi:hypothetical protein
MRRSPTRPARAAHRIAVALAAAVLAAWSAAPSTADAQKYRISQRGTISQTLGATEVSLDYSRPLVRGRSGLFGEVVHWGELWTPGANLATTLDVSDTITLDGHSVPTGTWSMWIIPSQVGPWELVLDPRDSLFHTQRPELTGDQIRFPLAVKTDAAHAEALTWSFPRIAQDGATLRMNWAAYEIDLEVGVKSIEPVVTVAADEAAPYIGAWQVTFLPNPAMGPNAPPPTVLTIGRTEQGHLRATYPPGAFGPPPGAPKPEEPKADLTPQERERAEAKRKLAEFEAGEFSYVLVPRARGVFLMGWMDDGMLYDVEEFFHEFEFEGDRAVRITFRNDKDEVMAKGVRK